MDLSEFLVTVLEVPRPSVESAGVVKTEGLNIFQVELVTLSFIDNSHDGWKPTTSLYVKVTNDANK